MSVGRHTDVVKSPVKKQDHCTVSQILDMVGSLLLYPFPTICRHAVAGDLLDLIERSGLNPGKAFDDLCKFVVRAHDREALEALKRLKDEECGDVKVP